VLVTEVSTLGKKTALTSTTTARGLPRTVPQRATHTITWQIRWVTDPAPLSTLSISTRMRNQATMDTWVMPAPAIVRAPAAHYVTLMVVA